MAAGCLLLFTVALEVEAEVSLCANRISCENNNYLTDNASAPGHGLSLTALH